MDADIQANLANLKAKFPDAEIPDEVRVSRIIAPDEYAEVFSRCLTDAGFTARAHPDGGIRFDEIPDEQAQAQAVALYTCQATYPLDPRYTQPLTGSQIAYLYDYYRDRLLPCLEGEGHTVSDLPSLTRFKESFDGTAPGYSPFESIARGSSAEEFQRVSGLCPDFPQDLWEH
ncbi:hypothetical protein D9V34_00625 [Mycetocola lacteus]|uniref:Uncharacterized protein n=1 Tax=Mycetocola lacteus TaxID=76637 RepID=A0A3L7AJQ5_9MICO|nr:hypothetical protein [Mycetocola lacteus]RLP80756.1 hypothetical protein D9V34_12920 [Mycetocola lacteus]RLP84541.1 hypothetical protein D9V34_00625 [Mycetocola lacteus]